MSLKRSGPVNSSIGSERSNHQRGGEHHVVPLVIPFSDPQKILGSQIMLSWALTFLIIALIAAVLGFGGLAGTASWAAQVCFVVFLILFVISAVTGRSTPRV